MLPQTKSFIEDNIDLLEKDIIRFFYKASIVLADPIEMDDLINILEKSNIETLSARYKILEAELDHAFELFTSNESNDKSDLDAIIDNYLLSNMGFSHYEIREFTIRNRDKWDKLVTFYPNPTWASHWVIESRNKTRGV